MRDVKQRIIQALSQRQKQRIIDARRVKSAVLLPLYYKQGEYYILFTKRTEKVKDHKGQISFPGGAYEDRDGTLLNTALRESAEEIGLSADTVEVLGELDDVSTFVSNYVISPFVALISWPNPLTLDPWETEEIIEVPMSALLEKNPAPKKAGVMNGKEAASYFYDYQGKIIWGATATILKQFLDIFTQVARDSNIP